MKNTPARSTAAVFLLVFFSAAKITLATTQPNTVESVALRRPTINDVGV